MEDVHPRLARLGSALAAPARARMLLTLLDGGEHSGTELSAAAGVGASTASAHLARLATAGLIVVRRQGRVRWVRLAGRSVAEWLEASADLAGRRGASPRVAPHLRAARSCYDHLAGELGVALCHQLRARAWISFRGHDFALTAAGDAALVQIGVAWDRAARRRLAPACLDWSERRAHLGGALGAALLAHMLRHAWLRRHLDSRALDVTPRGQRELHARFGLSLG